MQGCYQLPSLQFEVKMRSQEGSVPIPSRPRIDMGQALSWLRHQEMLYLSVLAMLIGLLAGYGAILLRVGIEWISMFWTGERSWSAALSQLPWYVYLVAPTVGGLFVGWLVHLVLPPGQLRGVAGVLEDLAERGGRVNQRQMATETLGTAVALGSGASLGREGPTVALGAAMASWLGQKLRLNEQQLRVLIGCGAAAGIAASFNTPIGGVLFAVEVILADYAINTFSPIVLAAVVATVITRAEIGNFPAFLIPEYHLVSAWEIPAYMGLGAICGLLATLLIHFLRPARTQFARLIPQARYRPAVAGFMLGLLGLAVPQVMSIGYGTVDAVLLEHPDPVFLGWLLPIPLFLAILLGAKLVATVLCSASGFPGGLLGPTIFLGASAGALFGGLVHLWSPLYTESYGAYALVACGAMTAAALQAPMTTILMVFELSGDYHIIVPLMAACIIATLIKRAFGKASVFTEALQERGVETDWHLERSWLRSVSVKQIPWRKLPRVRADTPLAKLKEVYVASGVGCVAVVDEEDLLLGIVTFSDLQPWLLDPSLDQVVVAAEIANRNVLTISEDGSLLEAIRMLDREVFEQMPVVAKDNPRKVLGLLSRNIVFSTYHKLVVQHGRTEVES